MSDFKAKIYKVPDGSTRKPNALQSPQAFERFLQNLTFGHHFLLDLCVKNDIIAVQEHWLANYDLDKVIHFNSEFSGIAHSAMTDKLQQGLPIWWSGNSRSQVGNKRHVQVFCRQSE